MFFSQALVIAAAAASALAAPTAQKLQPWQLTALTVFSPSGRPGSSPYQTLNATIIDPNTINAGQTPSGEAVFTPSQAQCNTQWEGALPVGKVFPCTSNNTEATWTAEITSGTNDANYTLLFKLTDKVTIPGQTVVKKFSGGDHFDNPDNLTGECGGSGVCYWYLKSSPYNIKQKETK